MSCHDHPELLAWEDGVWKSTFSFSLYLWSFMFQFLMCFACCLVLLFFCRLPDPGLLEVSSLTFYMKLTLLSEWSWFWCFIIYCRSIDINVELNAALILWGSVHSHIWPDSQQALALTTAHLHLAQPIFLWTSEHFLGGEKAQGKLHNSIGLVCDSCQVSCSEDEKSSRTGWCLTRLIHRDGCSSCLAPCASSVHHLPSEQRVTQVSSVPCVHGRDGTPQTLDLCHLFSTGNHDHRQSLRLHKAEN